MNFRLWGSTSTFSGWFTNTTPNITSTSLTPSPPPSTADYSPASLPTRNKTELFRSRRQAIQVSTDQSTKLLLRSHGPSFVSSASSSSWPLFFSFPTCSSSVSTTSCNSCHSVFGSAMILSSKTKLECFFCGHAFCTNCLNSCSQDFSQQLLHRMKQDTSYDEQKLENTISKSSDPQGRLLLCKKCEIIVYRSERCKLFKESLKEVPKKPIFQIYTLLSGSQSVIDEIFPHYEHLTSSIISSSDPFSNPKLIELNLQQETGEEKREAQQILQISEQAFELELRLMNAVKRSKAALKELEKLIAGLKATGNSPVDELVLANMRQKFSDHLKTFVPRLQVLQRNRMNVEIHKATQVYMVLYHLIWEVKQHDSYWASFGRSTANVLLVIRSELQVIVHSAGEDWAMYKKKVEDFLVDWEKHNKSLLQYSATAQTEGTVIRKTVRVIEKVLRLIDAFGEGAQFAQTRKVLVGLKGALHKFYWGLIVK